MHDNDNIVRLLFGSQSSTGSPAGAGTTIQTLPSAPQEAVDELNRIVRGGHFEWIAIRSGTDWDEARCRELMSHGAADPEIGAVLPVSSSRDSRDAPWQTLDSGAVFVVAPRIDETLLLRRAAVEVAGAFRDVENPLWDALIRMRGAGTRFTAWTVPEIDDAHFVLPDLTPSAPGRRHDWLRDCLWSASVPADMTLTSDVEWTAFQAGILQVHDFLEDSHQKSQSIEGQGTHVNGDYWHAIMHRREPDYGNSKYWFRRVGRHPIFPELLNGAREVLSQCDALAADHWAERLCGDTWDAFAFVDFCSECSRGRDVALKTAAERIQWREMCLLLDHTRRAAISV